MTPDKNARIRALLDSTHCHPLVGPHDDLIATISAQLATLAANVRHLEWQVSSLRDDMRRWNSEIHESIAAYDSEIDALWNAMQNRN